jgi:hypothetical protein
MSNRYRTECAICKRNREINALDAQERYEAERLLVQLGGIRKRRTTLNVQINRYRDPLRSIDTCF